MIALFIWGRRLIDRKPYRIAHLTDLHAAATWQPVLEAAALVAAGIPAAGTTLYALRETMQYFPDRTQIPVEAMLAATGTAAAFWAAMHHRKTRSMAKCVLAMLYQYNHSGSRRRKRLYRSLREHHVDHLIITGDLTVTAHPSEFQKVCDELAQYGFDRDNTTVVPGNHDRVQFPRSAAFEAFFPEVSFPDVREIAPGIIVSGVDSNIPESDWTLWDTITANTRGYIDPEQIKAMNGALDGARDETVITAVHHLPAKRRKTPFLPRPLKRTYADEPEHAADFREIIKQHDSLVLCGHDHPRHSRIVQFDGLKFCQGKASGLRFQHGTSYDIYDVLPGRSIQRIPMTVPRSA